MPMDRFLIAPLDTGLQTDMKPWLIADDAWAQLNNVYVFRGRARKRFGSTYMGVGTNLTQQALRSRLSILIGVTDGSGDLSFTAPGNIFQPGQGFSIGDTFFTVYQLGTPANMFRNDGNIGTATFNTTNGDFVITNALINTNVYFYTAQPVMGLTLYEKGSINNQRAFAFDTQFAYSFFNGFWQLSGALTLGPPPIGAVPQWHGTNLNFFWVTNWDANTNDEVAMFVTNFNATIGTPGVNDDPMWFYSNSLTPQWAPFSPYTVFLPDGSFVQTARIIVIFQNRLLLLNTIEFNGTTSLNAPFVNRCRFSLYGSPLANVTVGSDFAPFSFLEGNEILTVGAATSEGKGGSFVDATTEEQIVSAEFIKDRLIVYFERSTWELAYTGNQIGPFVWQKLNTELGSEAPNSTVPFDKIILTVGNTGIHACNGSNVERIDTKIPDQIFQINTNNMGTTRVAGIRDYSVEMVYWSFPSVNENVNDIFPNRVIVYNYRNNSWSFNDDCITVFGYFEQQPDLIWSSMTQTWEEANMTWNSGVLEAQSRQVIAGNQEGFVFLVQADYSQNAAAMQLTNITVNGTGLNLTIINHTLQVNDFIYLQNLVQVILNPLDPTHSPTFIFKIQQVIDSNTVFINPATLVGTYDGGAYVARVSQINMLSKQWNPYVDKGRDVYLAKIDFNVLKTTAGAVTVDYYPSYTSLSMINEGTATGTIMGSSVLEMFPYPVVPIESVQTMLWHQVYFQTQGEAIQINITLNDEQMLGIATAFSDFELEGLVLHTQATSSRLQ
jgi:hypothetical protein